jgi:hypothetical protein
VLEEFSSSWPAASIGIAAPPAKYRRFAVAWPSRPCVSRPSRACVAWPSRPCVSRPSRPCFSPGAGPGRPCDPRARRPCHSPPRCNTS